MLNFLKKSETPESNVVQAINDFTRGPYPQPTQGREDGLFERIFQLAESSPSVALAASQSIRKHIDLRKVNSNNVRKNALVLFLALLDASAKSPTHTFINSGVNSSHRDAIKFDVSSPGLEFAVRQNPAVSDYLSNGVDQHEHDEEEEHPISSNTGDIKFLAVYHYLLMHTFDLEVHEVAVETIKIIAQSPDFAKFESMQGLRHLYAHYINEIRLKHAIQASVIESFQYSGKKPLNLAGVQRILADGQTALANYTKNKDNTEARDYVRRILSVIKSLDDRKAFNKFPSWVVAVEQLRRDLEASLV